LEETPPHVERGKKETAFGRGKGQTHSKKKDRNYGGLLRGGRGKKGKALFFGEGDTVPKRKKREKSLHNRIISLRSTVSARGKRKGEEILLLKKKKPNAIIPEEGTALI